MYYFISHAIYSIKNKVLYYTCFFLLLERQQYNHWKCFEWNRFFISYWILFSKKNTFLKVILSKFCNFVKIYRGKKNLIIWYKIIFWYGFETRYLCNFKTIDKFQIYNFTLHFKLAIRDMIHIIHFMICLIACRIFFILFSNLNWKYLLIFFYIISTVAINKRIK